MKTFELTVIPLIILPIQIIFKWFHPFLIVSVSE